MLWSDFWTCDGDEFSIKLNEELEKEIYDI
jgi:hypothetical protein